MKSEKIIQDELHNLKTKTFPRLMSNIDSELDRENFEEALESCFTLMTNISAAIAAERVLS